MEFKGEHDYFNQEHVQVPHPIQEVLYRAVIGGTEAWLGISNDLDHLNKQGKMSSGYREPTKEEESYGKGPFGPYHEPKGNDIEKGLL